MDQQHFTCSTSMDSSSSSSSRKNSNEAWVYQLNHEKKYKKNKRSANRSCSFGLGCVTEEQEDIEEFSIHRFHRIQMPNDKLEFRDSFKQQRIKQPRRASLSPHGTSGLARVEEVRGDDDELKNKFIFKLGLMLDKAEFNQKNPRNFHQYERPSLEETNIILEDAQENVREQIQYQSQSPSYKLKVDEMDFNEKKQQWNSGTGVIEVIEEEKPEFDANAKEKEMFQQIKKILNEERDFLKKIVKGEPISEEDLIKKELIKTQCGDNWDILIQEAEENVLSGSDEENYNI